MIKKYVSFTTLFPLRLYIVLSVFIFLAELLIMHTLQSFNPHSSYVSHIFADALVITSIFMLALYYPYKKHTDTLRREYDQLAQEKKILQDQFENAIEPIFIVDKNLRYIDANKKALEVFGYSREELLSMSVLDLIPPDQAHKSRDEINKLLSLGSYENFQGLMRHRDGRWLNVEVGSSAILSPEGEFIGSRDTVRDITYRKELEAALQRSHDELEAKVHERTSALEAANAELQREIKARRKTEEAIKLNEGKLRALINAIPDMIFHLDEKGAFIDFKPSTDMQPIMPPDAFIGKQLIEILPASLAHEGMIHLVQALSTGEVSSFEYTLQTSEGLRNFEARFVAMSPREAIAMVRDVTQQKEARVQIERSLKQKELALQEIHHRVKNNMQVIASMMRLQSRYVAVPETQSVLGECLTRIQGMALIQDHLYQASDYSSVNFRTYITDLMAHIKRSFQNESSKFEFILNIEEASLSIDTAVPAGMLLTELVSNALMHGAPTAGKGTISISFAHKDDTRYLITVKDNGPGFDPSLYRESSQKSMGLNLIKILSETQLHATVKLDSGPSGTCFEISFLELQYKDRL